MAIDEAPPFWWEKPGWQAWALSPFSYLYGRVSAKRMALAPTYAAPVPVICVGNFIAGGAGKTPTVQLLSKAARKKGFRPGILSRGYGGAITSPTVVKPSHHNSHDVGDEALLHAVGTTTVVSPDRPAGAKLLLKQGCDLIIMDDGFQNPTLLKDFCLVVVDANRSLGNGFTMPAGPMRVPFRDQLHHANAVLVIGESDRVNRIVRRTARAGKPVFHASVRPVSANSLRNAKVLAFAGISDPSKLFDTLTSLEAEIVRRYPFGDHHFYTGQECEQLLTEAERNELQIVTTTKDAARLKGMGESQQKLHNVARTLEIELATDDPATAGRIIDEAIRYCSRRILNQPAKLPEPDLPSP